MTSKSSNSLYSLNDNDDRPDMLSYVSTAVMSYRTSLLITDQVARAVSVIGDDMTYNTPKTLFVDVFPLVVFVQNQYVRGDDVIIL